MDEGLDLEVYKDVPGYRGILRAVLKTQIQMLVQQLAKDTGEETVLLSACVTDGTFSHIGSDFGKDFMRAHDEFKAKFLGFCLEKHLKRKLDDRPTPKSKRFASASQIQRHKGHIAETLSTSPIPHVNPSLTARNPSLVPKSKTHTQVTPFASEDFSFDDSKSRREATQEKNNHNSNPAKSQSCLPYPLETEHSDNQIFEKFPMKEVELERTDHDPAKKLSEGQVEKGVHHTDNQGRNRELRLADSSYDYLLEEDRESELSPVPWQLNGVGLGDRQTVSKRKQYKPIRHTQDSLEWSGYTENVEYDAVATSLNKGDSCWFDRNNARNSSPILFSGIDMYRKGKPREDYGYAPMSDITFGELGEMNLSSSKYSDDASKYNLSMGDGEGFDSKKNIRPPQIDGLLVSRGEGRFEKLIKCDICGKICRTSNMARHKKRYCMGNQTSPSSSYFNPFAIKSEKETGADKLEESDSKIDLDLTDVGSSSSV